MKNIIVTLAKVVVVINGIIFFVLLGGAIPYSNNGGLGASIIKSTFTYGSFLIPILFIFSICGIILGVIVKVKHYEKQEKKQAGRGFPSFASMLLHLSSLILIISCVVVWFTSFGSV